MLRVVCRVCTPSEAGATANWDFYGTVNRRRQGRPPPGPTFIDQMPLVDVPATGIASDTAETDDPSLNPEAATSFMRSGRVPLFSILQADAEGPTTVPSAFTANGTFAGTLNAIFSVPSAYAFRMSMPPKRANRQITIARAVSMLTIAGRWQEAVSGMKGDSQLVKKAGTHRSKKWHVIQDEVYPHLAENDMRVGVIEGRAD